MSADFRKNAWAVAIAAGFMVVALARYSMALLPNLIKAKLPNPDSYYNIVVVLDGWANHQFPFIARDNAPFGYWTHWTMPYSWFLWLCHWPFEWLGVPEKRALLYGGAALTLCCMLLLALFVAIAVLRVGTRRATMVSGLILATSLPLMSYGRIDQITHHIFMLVPLAAAAACVLSSVRRPNAVHDALGGVLLGVALWITPETMPFVAGLFFVRIAARIQYPDRDRLWPIALGLIFATTVALAMDPPPPTFSLWALDRISLAYWVFAAMLFSLAVLADLLTAGLRCSLNTSVVVLVLSSVVVAAAWLVFVPGALQGPSGLVPPYLREVWWSHIQELQPPTFPAAWLAWVVMPLTAALLAGYMAWRERLLWLVALALLSLGYAGLSAWHGRMGAAAAVAAAITFAAAIARFRPFADQVETLSWREQAYSFGLTTFPVSVLLVSVLLSYGFPEPRQAFDCSLKSVAPTLRQLPPSTFLIGLYSAPELLYRTQDRVIAGPYNHNIAGMSDNYHAWRDTSADASEALHIVRKRHVQYVLGCDHIAPSMLAVDGRKTLAWRAATGEAPPWMQPVKWPRNIHTHWRLYKVVLPRG